MKKELVNLDEDYEYMILVHKFEAFNKLIHMEKINTDITMLNFEDT